MAATGATGISALVGCGSGSGGTTPAGTGTQYTAYRLSTKTKRTSNAAKKNAANKLFATIAAADAGRAHPGDRSDIVLVDLSEARWMQLFGGGADTADLRHL